jgi:hypothetical protein
MLNIVENDITSASVLLSLERVYRGYVMTEVVSAVVVVVMVMVHYRNKVCKFLYLISHIVERKSLGLHTFFILYIDIEYILYSMIYMVTLWKFSVGLPGRIPLAQVEILKKKIQNFVRIK